MRARCAIDITVTTRVLEPGVVWVNLWPWRSARVSRGRGLTLSCRWPGVCGFLQKPCCDVALEKALGHTYRGKPVLQSVDAYVR